MTTDRTINKHLAGVYVERLLKVPWFVIDSAERKEIVDEPPWKATDSDELDTDEIKNQLKALRYR